MGEQIGALTLDRRKRPRLQEHESIEQKESTHCDKNIDEENRYPSGFCCPLTMEPMFDPVLDSEGNTYERSALLTWLKDNRTSPVSRQPLNERMVITNNALRETIHEFMGPEWVARQKAEHASVKTSLPSRMRSKIDCFLQHMCQDLGGLDLKLNEYGCCAFQYDGITIVLDVPEHIGVFCLYTKNLVTGRFTKEVYRCALELNFLQGETRGGCLSIRRHKSCKEEIMFSYTDRVPEVSAHDFSNILLNFVETAVRMREKLLTTLYLHEDIMEELMEWGEESEEESIEADDLDLNKSNHTTASTRSSLRRTATSF